MTKVVINGCYGGFGISEAVATRLRSEGHEHLVESSSYGPQYLGERDHPAPVAAVEALGAEANGEFAKLRVVEIPDDAAWHIEEYDGIEHIAEDHRTWG